MCGNVHYFSVLDMNSMCLVTCIILVVGRGLWVSGNVHYFSVLHMDCRCLVTCIISVCWTWTVCVW